MIGKNISDSKSHLIVSIISTGLALFSIREFGIYACIITICSIICWALYLTCDD